MDDFTINPQENMFGLNQVNVNTNIRDEMSNLLVESLKNGKLNPKQFQMMNERLKLNINMKFNNDYSLDFSTNDYIGEAPVDYKAKITKGF